MKTTLGSLTLLKPKFLMERGIPFLVFSWPARLPLRHSPSCTWAVRSPAGQGGWARAALGPEHPFPCAQGDPLSLGTKPRPL